MGGHLLLTLACISSLFITFGHAVTTVITPASFQEVMQSTAKVRCIVDNVDGNIQSITAMTIVKDNTELLVLVTSGFFAFTYSDEVEGSGWIIDNDPMNSEIYVDIPDPTTKFSGVYTCTVVYLDSSNLLKEDTSQSTMAVKAFTAKDLNSTIETLKSDVEDLKTFKDPDCHSVFAMTTKADKNLNDGETLILPDEISKHGKGYDPATGVFTTPCIGTYVFQLSVRIGMQACPNGQTLFNDHCYLPVTTAMTSSAARTHCSSNVNGFIAAPRNPVENSFLHNFKLWDRSGAKQFLIGISDKTTEGTWKLEDGSDLIYTNWDNNQPDDGRSNQDVAVMRSNHKWDDVFETWKRPFVCVTKKRESTFKVMAGPNELFRVHATIDQQGSGSASVYLNKGTEVKVVVSKGTGTKLVENSHAVFSGHLVMKLE